MKEFSSVKVSAFDSDSLASTLTAKSAEGWTVVSIVSVLDGAELVAFLSREATSSAASTNSTANTISAPATPTATNTTPSVPADWYKDPAGRYEYRYWDGTKWTEHVSRAGTVLKDPPTP
ncbi:MAG: hypothetical protein B7C54_05895 [Acidimicrobiales bacterium mtb01]|nr:DUF2510 domain-containing protein [Actinomycetota bacterium]TEX46725.1 MAG: hypothetical protein B7C54_05895 [Acidimicrobiales bacterium mtb01]